MINGRVFDWESITIDASWGAFVNCLAITYKAEAPVEAIYGRGPTPRGYGRGNLSQTATLDVAADDNISVITAQAEKEGGLFRIKPFTITVSYANNGDLAPQEDVLNSCVFTSLEKAGNQGDMEIAVHKFNLIVLDPITLNGIPVI